MPLSTTNLNSEHQAIIQDCKASNMRKDFLIVSLPRSRSAWLACYLSSYKGVYVDHELMVRALAGATIEPPSLPAGVMYYGSTISGSLHYYSMEFFREYAGNILIVERPIPICLASLLKHKPNGVHAMDVLEALNTWQSQIDWIKENCPKAMVVPFHELERRLPEITSTLLHRPADPEKAAILKDYKIGSYWFETAAIEDWSHKLSLQSSN